MMSKRMADAINEQINAEFYSAFLYLSMAAQLEEMNLPGFANWMRVQYKEEEFHAMKFLDHMVERGERVVLREMAAPQVEWESALAMFEAAYAHEIKVTGMINDLVNIAIEDSDFASNNFLQWYVGEQVEEEDNTSTVRDKIKMVQDMPGGLYMLDQELALRVYTPPPGAGGPVGA
jgi:ferritin